MNHVWQLQEAKEHLGSVIEEATKNGAQIINSQGIAQAVVLSMENYQQLLQSKPQTSLVKFFQTSPLHDISLDLERNADIGA